MFWRRSAHADPFVTICRTRSRTRRSKLIQAAVRAPSAVNRQPSSFTVVRDGLLLDQISKRGDGHDANAHDR